jgi:hypothetical protein
MYKDKRARAQAAAASCSLTAASTASGRNHRRCFPSHGTGSGNAVTAESFQWYWPRTAYGEHGLPAQSSRQWQPARSAAADLGAADEPAGPT